MCIGVPMVIETLDGFSASCEARGCRRSVSLILLEPGSVRPGDHVLVHQGLAMRALDPAESALIWEAFDLVLAAGGDTGNSPGAAPDGGPLAPQTFRPPVPFTPA